MWFDFKNVPVKALRSMCKNPLGFSAVSFIERTFNDNDDINPSLKAIAELYDQERDFLNSKLGNIAYDLTYFNRPNGDNISQISIFPIKVSYTGNFTFNCIGNAWDSNNLQIDRILEWFNVNPEYSSAKNSSYIDRCICFYALNEALFMTFAGVCKVSSTAEGFSITIKDSYRKKLLHRKWFANLWDTFSKSADLAIVDSINTKEIYSEAFYQQVLSRSLKLRDKYFSIPDTNLPQELNESLYVSWINKLCIITILALWCATKTNLKFTPYRLLNHFSIIKKDIDRLSLVLNGLPEPDQFLSITESGDIRLEKPSIQLRTVMDGLAKFFSLSSGAYNQQIGDFFEKGYLREYFEDEVREYSEHYQILKFGIEKHEVKGLTQDAKFDIDFIIKDLRRSRFIFVQAKYVQVGGTAYIAGDLDHLVGPLWRGLNQIEGAKQAFELGLLDELLVEKGVLGATPENSTFALIHNVSNFDFQLLDSGVVSYEWNTFRNLIKDGRFYFGESKQLPDIYSLGYMMPVENPDKVIELLMNKLNGPSYSFEQDNVNVSFDIQSQRIVCQGMGL